MNKNLLIIGTVALVFLASCGNDDDPRIPDPVEGKWKLEAFQLTEAPAGFTSWEGVVLEIGQLVSWEDYEVNFMANNTFTRRIYLPGADVNDDGTWTKEGDLLILISNEDTTFEEEYNIEENSDAELIWSELIQLSLIEDAVRDTLTQAYVDTLTEEEFDALFTDIDIKLNYVFNKEVE